MGICTAWVIRRMGFRPHGLSAGWVGTRYIASANRMARISSGARKKGIFYDINKGISLVSLSFPLTRGRRPCGGLTRCIASLQQMRTHAAEISNENPSGGIFTHPNKTSNESQPNTSPSNEDPSSMFLRKKYKIITDVHPNLHFFRCPNS